MSALLFISSITKIQHIDVYEHYSLYFTNIQHTNTPEHN